MDPLPEFLMANRTLALIELGIKAAPFFAELRRYLPSSIRCVYYSRRAVVRSVLRQSGAELFPRRLSLPAPLPISEDRLRAAIGEKALATEPPAVLARAARLLRDLSDFFEQEQVGALLVWNGSGLTASLAVHLARQRGWPVIFGENGYLPATLQLDPEGVNQYASIAAAVREHRAQLPAGEADDARLDQVLADFRAGRSPAMQAPPKSLKADWRAKLRREAARLLQAETWAPGLRLSSKDFPARLTELPPRFVLLPFQVSQDSQLILHSPLVGGDMHQLLRVVEEAVRTVDPQLRLVVKLHPAESSKVLAGYRGLPRRYPQVQFTLRHPLNELLLRCEAVVTINSTVGFEAIVFDKPVVTLGRNFYVAPGLVHPVETLAQLPVVLQRALRDPPDLTYRRAFLRYVYFRFLTQGSYRDFSAASFAAVADRVTALIGNSA